MPSYYPWQHAQWQQLAAARQQQRFPHALLLSGTVGMGKVDFAHALAAGLLCFQPTAAGEACGQCKACQLLHAESHPDLRVVAPAEAGKQIPVDNIRALIQYASLTAQYDHQKVILIHPAEAMNINAANSLLKLLEEPPPATILLLISHNPASLLATIRSRCQRIEFKNPTVQVSTAWLQQHNIDAAALPLLLKLAHDAPLAARDFAEQGLLTERQHLLKALIQLPSGKTDPLKVVDTWQKIDPAQLLTWMMSWTMDLIRYALTRQTQYLTNQDYAEPLQQLAMRLDTASLFKLLDRQQQAYQLVTASSNVKAQGLLDELAVAWLRLGKIRQAN